VLHKHKRWVAERAQPLLATAEVVLVGLINGMLCPPTRDGSAHI